MEIYTATGEDGFEQMLAMIHAGKVRSRDAMTDAQRALCDGKVHWVINVEFVDREVVLSWSRLLSKEELLDGEGENAPYLEEVYYGEDGSVSYGYLPVHTWDAVYQPVEPDLHDRVACQMYEISEEDFNRFRDCEWKPERFIQDPHLQQLVVKVVTQHIADREANW
jgi:hypothetical protein